MPEVLRALLQPRTTVEKLRANPFISSFHFGYRISARSKGHLFLRVAMFLLPLPVMVMAEAFIPAYLDSLTLAYALIGLLTASLLPVACFRFFGVRRLDRSIVEELRLTRVSDRDVLIGLAFWPAATSLAGLATLFTGNFLAFIFDSSCWVVSNALWYILAGLIAYPAAWALGFALAVKYWLLERRSRQLLVIPESIHMTIVLFLGLATYVNLVWRQRFIPSYHTVGIPLLAAMLAIPAFVKFRASLISATDRLFGGVDAERSIAAWYGSLPPEQDRTAQKRAHLAMSRARVRLVAPLLVSLGIMAIIGFAVALHAQHVISLENLPYRINESRRLGRYALWRDDSFRFAISEQVMKTLDMKRLAAEYALLSWSAWLAASIMVTAMMLYLGSFLRSDRKLLVPVHGIARATFGYALMPTLFLFSAFLATMPVAFATKPNPGPWSTTPAWTSRPDVQLLLSLMTLGVMLAASRTVALLLIPRRHRHLWFLVLMALGAGLLIFPIRAVTCPPLIPAFIAPSSFGRFEPFEIVLIWLLLMIASGLNVLLSQRVHRLELDGKRSWELNED